MDKKIVIAIFSLVATLLTVSCGKKNSEIFAGSKNTAKTLAIIEAAKLASLKNGEIDVTMDTENKLSPVLYITVEFSENSNTRIFVVFKVEKSEIFRRADRIVTGIPGVVLSSYTHLDDKESGQLFDLVEDKKAEREILERYKDVPSPNWNPNK